MMRQYIPASRCVLALFSMISIDGIDDKACTALG